MQHKTLCKQVLLLLLLCMTISLQGQEKELKKEIDFDEYYSFPFGIGVDYRSLSPISDFGRIYQIHDLAGSVRYPLPSIPELQILGRGGILVFDTQGDSMTYDHKQFYGALGAGYFHKLDKKLEMGAGLTGGYGYAYFPNLIPEAGTLGSPSIFGEINGVLALNPSYNLNIEVKPEVKYLHYLSSINDFNGFLFSLGFGINYRFGEDPDAPAAVIRSLRFDEVSLPPLYAAMQSYYTKYPAGSVKITNTEKFALTDVAVSFFQPGFMDSPTPGETLSRLEAGETREIKLLATFNGEVFKTEGIIPLTGEVIITYQSRKRPAEQRKSVTYELHDKTAILWNDDRKVSAFITPADSALRNYTSFIHQTTKELILPAYNKPLQTGLQIFNALGVLGCLYQADPRAPFTTVQGNVMVVDSVSLPRDTLRRITGDCDDLTVLYCSLLETVGIETGFITVPGHIYAAFNTGETGQGFKNIHPKREMTINVDGNIWVPVEITMIDKGGFLKAWEKGAEEWNFYDKEPEKRRLYLTREAQEIYRPVGLKETDLGLQYGNMATLTTRVNRDLDDLIGKVTALFTEASGEAKNKQSYNQLGLTYAQFARYSKAVESFNQALKLDPGFTPAKINLGNCAFMTGDYKKALDYFREALSAMEKKQQGKSVTAFKVLINISRAYNKLENYADSENYYKIAQALDPEKARSYEYLSEVSTGSDRAAERDEAPILFIGEEE